MKFNELNISKDILRSIEEVGYVNPTPIQEQAIPEILQGKDIIGCAQTGTGKTAAFAIPILSLLENKKDGKIKTLILTPTRELALQIYENFEAYGKYTPLRTAVIFGGVNQSNQVRELKKGIDILIATPGRLMDLHKQKFIDLKSIEIFVLDEADRMLDMGFVHDVKRVITLIPRKRQTLLFSATMPKEIQQLASTLLRTPVHISVTPVSSVGQTISQEIYKVDKPNKTKLLMHVLKDKSLKQVLVFTRTKHGADRVVRDLKNAGMIAYAIHGNKSQNARQSALKGFKSGDIRVLVATDIAARGIDINELELVVNFDLPNISETYVHRIGRTGRAGAQGRSISFCDFEEQAYLKDIEKLLGKKLPTNTNHPYPMQVFEIVEKPVRVRRGRANAKVETEQVVKPKKEVGKKEFKSSKDKDKVKKFDDTYRGNSKFSKMKDDSKRGKSNKSNFHVRRNSK